MKHRSVLAAAATVALLFSLTPAATAAKQSTTARTDKLTVQVTEKKIFNVLRNDTLRGKRKGAKVRVTKKPAKFVARVNAKKNVVIRPKKSVKPGRYVVRYKVTSKKSSDTARIIIQVRAKKKTPGTKIVKVIKSLDVKTEVRNGYNRNDWKHWNSGLISGDGCDTRREVLLAEAVVAPTVGSRCSFTGGEWFSYFDAVSTTDSSKFDIDHLVPLAEAHDSGGYAWDNDRREAYANDQGDPRSLVAVSASSNRSKGDKDPAEWFPPATSSHCQYVSEWVAVKARWDLAVDTAERKTLINVGKTCGNPKVVVKKYTD